MDLNAVLNGDGSPADKLVVDGENNAWAASGSTLINVHNTTGKALHPGNGILVVEAINDAITTPTAFTLNNILRVGAREYRLFRGGSNPNDPTAAQDWFLRSSFKLGPIIGPEISLYSSAMPTTLEMNRLTLGIWDERIGQTGINLLAGDNHQGNSVRVNGGWVRVFNQSYNEHMTVIIKYKISAQITGVQGSIDLYRNKSSTDAVDLMGLYIAFTKANQNITGIVTNPESTAYIYQQTGSVNENANTGGLYWTHTMATGGYIDLVAQGSFYSGHANSPRTSLPLSGGGTTESVELGCPLQLTSQWALEPQAQLIYNFADFC